MMQYIKRTFLISMLLSLFSSLGAHEGHKHDAPWKACEKAKKEDICSYTNGLSDLYRGTCQYFKTTLMCIRNKPIIKASQN